MITTLKPGQKTTEFLLVVLTAIGLVASAAADWLPPRYAAIGTAIATAAYAVSRGLAKSNPPKDAATTVQTPPPSA